MRLNCDLGESFGSWTMGMDEAVMPHIDQANIACGFHAGDPLIMQRTLSLAKEHGVMVGAHPAYPDLVGFGRRSMNCSADEIKAFMLYQLSAMDGMAKSVGVELEYVKPHGALYNDMMAKVEVRKAIMEAVAAFHKPIKLMLQATPQADEHKAEAAELGLELWFEAFADRCYDDDGKLLARSKAGAVHNKEKMLAQVEQLCDAGTITTVSGHTLNLQVDTLCVHGDNLAGVQAIEAIRALVDQRAS
ncbi:5-oxoprolinase subunit PxpA [Dasania sp. GY-MA-18]|uniref:5-oxoprolinase subunit PxpA n=1 Tax=Dasania phycosphaerae TaxID=2950436 RepID=A0A9J6RPH0_9GAMM|nr:MULTISPECIES: 5-oxoprolinase subunit PxpA [Dasania]MCR8923638.1 5-oxoprolinase subunit PxpA [Dasania sp. GY-MA-18]MCZ0866072.1 5-oxoprolinase subunit PxpA [Dasania phycosphaerae]MCZ0869796.1 5-oxoprolinase subunit PxpA [Dasania phycosphaerae]